MTRGRARVCSTGTLLCTHGASDMEAPEMITLRSLDTGEVLRKVDLAPHAEKGARLDFIELFGSVRSPRRVTACVVERVLVHCGAPPLPPRHSVWLSACWCIAAPRDCYLSRKNATSSLLM